MNSTEPEFCSGRGGRDIPRLKLLQEQEDKSWEKELWLCYGYAMARSMDSYAVPIAKTRLSYSQAIAVGQRSVHIHLVGGVLSRLHGQFHS